MGDWMDGCGVDALRLGWCFKTANDTQAGRSLGDAPQPVPPGPGGPLRWQQLAAGSKGWSCGIRASDEPQGPGMAYCW